VFLNRAERGTAYYNPDGHAQSDTPAPYLLVLRSPLWSRSTFFFSAAATGLLLRQTETKGWLDVMETSIRARCWETLVGDLIASGC
jgi:hypothetical protein